MTSRSSRGRWERVLAARRQARAVLGIVPSHPDPYAAPPLPRAPVPPLPGPVWVKAGPPERVLSLGEAASRLGASRGELEAMIAAGKVEALPCGFTRMVPTREIHRLRKS